MRGFRIPGARSASRASEMQRIVLLAPRNISLRRKITEMPECANPYDLQGLGRPPGGEIRESSIISQKFHFLDFCALFAKSCELLEI